MTEIKNLVIIGSGPAGLSCAIYAARCGIEPIIVAGDTPGGLLTKTDMVENYPGFNSINGGDLMVKMLNQAESLGTSFIYETVEQIEKMSNGTFKIALSDGNFLFSKTVLISTGSNHKNLEIPGEKEYSNKGVSWCATCDGPMYRNKKVAVVGGGNTAVMEALFLSNFADTVYLIHRRNTFRAEKVVADRVISNTKIKIFWNSIVQEIHGEERVNSISLKQDNSIEKTFLEVDGVFIAIGVYPMSHIFKNIVELDEEGYIIADNSVTSCKGVFAAGDVVSGSLKQAIYAAGQGALASYKIEKYLGIR
ncbi:MAG: thioredoxin-disulfide reductase [Holosporales bacterium]|jgi:thioredoxin reductase (NADPH)|nr:thioredoxin-disulfide reductase [Holosporales bacterium]